MVVAVPAAGEAFYAVTNEGGVMAAFFPDDAAWENYDEDRIRTIVDGASVADFIVALRRDMEASR